MGAIIVHYLGFMKSLEYSIQGMRLSDQNSLEEIDAYPGTIFIPPHLMMIASSALHLLRMIGLSSDLLTKVEATFFNIAAPMTLFNGFVLPILAPT